MSINMVPRQVKYNPHQCDSLSTLFQFGWTVEDVDHLLGKPDARKLEGGAAYGSERALLAALSDRDLLQRMPEDSRPHYYRRRLLEADEESEPIGVALKLEGRPWVVLCQTINAEDGTLIKVPLASRPESVWIEVIATYSSWREFSLVKTKRVS